MEVKGVQYVCFLLLALLIFSGCNLSKEMPQTRALGSEFDAEQYKKPSSTGLYTQSWALIIGINRYRSSAIRPLSYAEKDARDIKTALERTGFPSDNIFLLLNHEATKDAIEEHFYERLGRRANQDDRVLVFFAGHGEQEQRPHGGEENFLLPHDADRNNLPRTALSLEELRRIGNWIKARHILFVLDACHSGFPIERVAPGELTPEHLQRLARTRAMQILSAGRSGETAKEQHGNGIFTSHLLRGLEGLADFNKDGLITLGELYVFVFNKVSEETFGDQNPQLGRLAGEGEFLFRPSSSRYLLMGDRHIQRPDPIDSTSSSEASFVEDESIYALAFSWVRLHAERGEALAQAFLGALYLEGRGVKKNEAEGLRWIRKAADQGSALAQGVLGKAYINGIGVDPDEVTGKFWLHKAAEQGDALAQAELGEMYAEGRGVKRDETQAIEWFQKSAGQGDAQAQAHLSLMYRQGRGVPKDEAKGIDLLHQAADQGYASAQAELGWMYLVGRGVAQDDAVAMEWFRKAAEQGHAAAQAELGWLYAYGDGVPRDDAAAVEWFRKAAKQGNSNGQAWLGMMHVYGDGVPRDDAIAMELFRKAAKQGNSNGQAWLGWLYAEGRGVARDYAVAMEWFRKAADQGHSRAQIELGWMYAYGRGVKQDDMAAVEWFRKAADQGHSRAQVQLGEMYAEGRGVKQDDMAAVEWFRKAAEKENSDSQTWLGWMYAEGRGVKQDDMAAAEWFRKAAKQGNEHGQAWLSWMYAKGRGVARDDAAAAKWLHKAAQGYLPEIPGFKCSGPQCWPYKEDQVLAAIRGEDRAKRR
jgi:TPR repeat protein